MRCADRRRRHYRIAGRRTPDASGPRRRHRRSRVAGARQHGGFHLHAAVGNRPAAARAERGLRLRARLTRLSRQPRCRRRPEIAGLAARHRLRHARQEFAVSCGRRKQRQPGGRASLRGRARACPAIFSTMPCCWIVLASRVPVRSSRRARPMPIRCNWRMDCSGHRCGARRAAVRGRGCCVRCRRPLGQCRSRQAAARSRRAPSCSPPAMSCPISFAPPCMRCRRAGRLRPCRSRKTSGTTAR